MAAKVILEITEGNLKGRRFEFAEHDTFILGRGKGSHARLPGDPRVSRHHLLLELNPPDASLRDLGSLNGTIVNGEKHGGRKSTESPEEGARRAYPTVSLKPGDLVRVGDTCMRVKVDLPERPITQLRSPTPQRRTIACQECGNNVTDEAGPGRTGDYICEECRARISSDPIHHLRGLIRQAADQEGRSGPPDIPGFRIDQKLGAGGMGVVYKCFRETTDEVVAVKVMLSKIAVDPKAREAFLRECELLSKLSHPNIVALEEFSAIGGAFYFVMSFCNGGSIGDVAKKRGGKLAWPQIGPLFVQAIDGMEYAHQQGLVHRDIKPENILLHRTNRQWEVRVADFGLAKSFQKAGFSGMTTTGSHAGTYPFMPREQLTNFKYAQPVSDIWSLAASIYKLLTAQYPRDFDKGRDPFNVILEGNIVPIQDRDPSIPDALAAALDKALSNDVSERFQTAADFKAALTSVF